MMRWFIIGLVAYVLFKLVTNEARKRAEGKQSATPREDAAAENTGNMVKDPVCGAYVDAASSISVRNGAQVDHFCSYECRDSFLEQLRGRGQNTAKSVTDNPEQKSGKE